MENENPSLEELEAEIALYHRRISETKAHPAYKADAEVRAAVANLERTTVQLEEAVAAKHAELLLQEMEDDRKYDEAGAAFNNLRTALINELLNGTENREGMIKMAAEIRAVERLHDTYDAANWAAVAHLLPVVE